MKSLKNDSWVLIFLLSLLGSLSFQGNQAFASVSAAVNSVEFEQDHSVPIVNLALTFRTGAVADPDGKMGLTNLAGELLLRGTRSKTKAQFDQAIDDIGASLEVEVRAEAVILRGAVLSSQLNRFLGLMKEALLEPRFDSVELEKLKNEIIAGLEEQKGRDPKLAGELYTRFFFGDHPYGNSVLGTISEIKRSTMQDVQEQYETVFRRNIPLLIGSGDASPAELKAYITAIQEKLTLKGARDSVTPLTSPGLKKKREILFVDKPDRTQVQVLVGQNGITFKDPEFFPLHVGNFVFGGGSFSSRLMKEIRVKRGWSYGAGSTFRFGTKPRSWNIMIMPKTQDASSALRQVMKMIEELQKGNIRQDEFEQAQMSLVNSSAFMENTPEKRVENRVLEATLDLPRGFMGTWRKKLSEVSLKEVNEALTKFIAPERVTILVLGSATPEFLEKLAEAAGVNRKDIRVIRYTEDL